MRDRYELQGSWVDISLLSAALGERATWRLRLDVDDCRPSFPTLMVVTWPSATFPSLELREHFAEFERATSGLSFGPRSRLVASLISGDGKSWSFRSVDSDEFLADLNRALTESPGLPLRIQTRSDPEWSEYDELKKFVEAKVRDAQASESVKSPNRR